MTDAITLIKQQQAEAKLRADTEYELLVQALAAGEAPPPDVLAVLSAAGRSTDDLAEDVRLTTERKQLEPVAATLEQAGIERIALHAKFEETAKVYEQEVKKARRKIQEKILDPVNEEMKAAIQRHDAAREAHARLTQIKNEQERTAALRAKPVTVKRGN